MRSCGAVLGLAAVLLSGAAAFGQAPADQRRSGFEFMAPETQAMQRDDTANPGMLWVRDGEALWAAKAGTADVACSGCHGDAKQSMRGAAPRYPAYDAHSGGPITLAGRIEQCRTQRQGARSLGPESQDLLALTSYVAHQSRGLPVSAPDERLARNVENGRSLYEARQGQLNLSCAQCHDDNAGARLAGSTIPQAHPTGYPLYRLEWQSVGSLQRRLRGCLSGMRAEPYAYGSPEFVDLELYLNARAAGLPLETPAVRP
jgi:sulfur-oxidizing protein SoxA